MPRTAPAAPTFEQLPARLARATPREQADRVVFSVKVKVVTPIFGGAAITRSIDEVDVIRVPSIRGHLRMWWRAQQSTALSGPALAQAEKALWGGATDTDGGQGGRSPVEIAVKVLHKGEVDKANVELRDPGSYATWPARRTQNTREAPRRKVGTIFELTLSCPPDAVPAVKSAVRAWLLFGGYGGRTRRGCGGLTVEGTLEERHAWLPTITDDGTLHGLPLVLPLGARGHNDTPSLCGATLLIGTANGAAGAWQQSLDWLRDFRQGAPGTGPNPSHHPNFARERGADNTRPGRSTWPEADKIRRLASLPRGRTGWAHAPLHNDVPVFPRAGFGLPIVGQFQRNDRHRAPYALPEPNPYEIKWRRPRNRPNNNRHRDDAQDQDEVMRRLASPLIVKALPLADGRFVPCALWLNRTYPAGQVYVEGNYIGKRGAAFDDLVAPGEGARYHWLTVGQRAPRGSRLKTAFIEWLKAQRAAREVR